MLNHTFLGENIPTRTEAAVSQPTDPSLHVPQTTALPATQGAGKISHEEARRLLTAGDVPVTLIDVRSPKEHAAAFIPGSVNIPADDIVSQLEKMPIPGGKNAIILVYCQKGARSAKAYEALKAAGYVHAYNLGGLESWPYEVARGS